MSQEDPDRRFVYIAQDRINAANGLLTFAPDPRIHILARDLDEAKRIATFFREEFGIEASSIGDNIWIKDVSRGDFTNVTFPKSREIIDLAKDDKIDAYGIDSFSKARKHFEENYGPQEWNVAKKDDTSERTKFDYEGIDKEQVSEFESELLELLKKEGLKRGCFIFTVFQQEMFATRHSEDKDPKALIIAAKRLEAACDLFFKTVIESDDSHKEKAGNKLYVSAMRERVLGWFYKNHRTDLLTVLESMLKMNAGIIPEGDNLAEFEELGKPPIVYLIAEKDELFSALTGKLNKVAEILEEAKVIEEQFVSSLKEVGLEEITKRVDEYSKKPKTYPAELKDTRSVIFAANRFKAALSAIFEGRVDSVGDMLRRQLTDRESKQVYETIATRFESHHKEEFYSRIESILNATEGQAANNADDVNNFIGVALPIGSEFFEPTEPQILSRIAAGLDRTGWDRSQNN